MPVRSEMRRYPSTGSLYPSGSGFSTTTPIYSDDRQDSMYQSSPDLSQGSHGRSLSSDSMDGSYHGNHSRQSSGSADGHSRSNHATRRQSTALQDPLQFIKTSGAKDLAKVAKTQIELAKEVNKMRVKVNDKDSGDDWQSNLSSWKSRRKSQSRDMYARVEEVEASPGKDPSEVEDGPKIKPYSEIKEASEKRKSLGKLTSFYPVDDDNLSISTKSTLSDKDADQNDDSVFVKEEAPTTKTAPTARLKNNIEPEDIAPWAKDDDQVDSEEKIVKDESKESSNVLNSEPVRMRSHGPSSKKDADITKRYSMPVNMEISVHKSKQLWERNVNDSSSKKPSDKKPVGISAAKSIDNIRKAFEQESSNTHDISVQRPSKSLDLSSVRISTPKALVPLLQRPSRLGQAANAGNIGTSVRGSQLEFIEKTVKMSQKPNHSRGFGFAISGGSDLKQPLTVHKVSLGGAADVCELQMNDEIITMNKLEVHHLTHSQAQAVIDKAVKTGQLELKIRRYMDDRAHGLDSSHSTDNDEAFHSPNEAEMLSEDRSSPFRRDKTKRQSDSSSLSFDSSLQDFNRSENNESSSIMDKLLAENRHETYQNEIRQLDSQSKPQQRTWKGAESPVMVQEDVIQSDTAPSRTLNEPITFSALNHKPNTVMPSKGDKEPESGAGSMEDRTSSISKANDYSKGDPVILEEPITIQTVSRQQSAPGMECQTYGVSKSDTITEERSTIIRRNKPDLKYAKVTESIKIEPLSCSSPLKQSSDAETMDSPPPPPPPKDEPPPLLRRISNEDTNDSAGVGPPAILKRWQKTSKLENKLSSESSFDQPAVKDNRYSFSFSLRSDDVVTKGSGGTNEDFVLDKTTRDFEATVSQQKPLVWKATSSFSTNAERKKIDEWNRQQETARQPSPTTPTVNDRKQDEEYLTAQERFERDKQRINEQYEEEKRKAAEEEKRKKEEEEKLLQSQMEQLIQRSTVPSLSSQMNGKPDQQQQPMTFRLESSPGRPLMIDPRNQPDHREESLPQYSFHVDLRGKQESSDLERERERIRKEEKLRLEEEKRQWEEEEKRRILQKEAELRAQEERILREQERLKKQQEEMEREKAQLEAERNRETFSRIQSSNERSGPVPIRPHSIHVQLGAQHSSSSSSSPKSPPPALEPRHMGSSPSRSSWSPTSSNSKVDTTAREKTRLTREDLLAMNRKATPLQDRPEGSETDKVQSEPVAREIPSKAQLHSLNVVPKPRFTQSTAWIKDSVEDSDIKRPGRISLIKDRDYSNQNDHWLVQEAERRRLAGHPDTKAPPNRHSMQMIPTPVKPVSSLGVNKWRDDMQATNSRPTYQSGVSSESRFSASQPLVAKSVMDRSPERDTQFSARPQSSSVSLSQTLPANFSFNASIPSGRRGKDPPVPPVKPVRAPNIDRSQSEQVMAVSGKQPCSYCGEELGFGAAMVVESLGLYYHVQCFRCCVCQTPLGNGSEGADVRVRANKLHCQNCYSNDQAGLKFSKV
ncbi:hypothetical protein ACJMK2_031514 [Sinanodonta woodiana]|uniref:LIM domain only protein 7 n=1 Tax=Sinanodonta woodiana TaxID=1069815 RepID=A0ABD3X0T7_SINWO